MARDFLNDVANARIQTTGARRLSGERLLVLDVCDT